MPGLKSLGQNVWTTEQGAQGPIILATGLWLLAREAASLPVEESPRRLWMALCYIVPIAVIYVLSYVLGKLWLMWGSTYAVLIFLLYIYVGKTGLAKLWFPLFYLAFLTPPPEWLIVPITGGLKDLIAVGAVDILSFFHYQVASGGTVLYIDQYELVIAAACSGMNSLVTLLAIGLFYIFLRHRADWRYAMMLAVLIIPVALFSNLMRVIIILLMTHYFGDALAQGMLHEATGFMMFFIALFTLILVDMVLMPLRVRLSTRRES